MKPFLYLAFFFSGASGLIYQTVWVRMLTRFLGSTTYSTATVLGVFMGGLAAGSFVGGRIADRSTRRPLLYAIVEIAVAVTGLAASFFVIASLGQVYVSAYHVFSATPGAILFCQIAFVLVCLLPPTVLMGATLPLLTTHLTRKGVDYEASLGSLYAINTFGAVVGVLAAGYVLLGSIGESESLYVAAALNVLAAGLIVPLMFDATPDRADDAGGGRALPAPFSPVVQKLSMATIFVSGFTALSYEIIWTRLLTLVLKTSIYAFATMLAVFLLGIGFGSWASTKNETSSKKPVVLFGMLEIGIACWAMFGLILFPSFEPWVLYGNTAVLERAIACAMVVGPIAFFFGWQFPIAVRCCVTEASKAGNLTGNAYAANTIGTILGSLGTGFVLLPIFGAISTMMALASVNVVLGIALVMLAPSEQRENLGKFAWPAAATFVILLFFVGDPYMKVIEYRVRKEYGPDGKILAYHETPSSTTVAVGLPGTQKMGLWVNGIGMTSLSTETKLMAHVPYLLAKDPKRMLVICFGMGTTLRSASLHPELHVDAVDILPEVFDCFETFHADAAHVRKRENVRFYAQDGRNFLAVHPEKYDVISVDPAPPVFSAGTVNIYSLEFLQLCKSRLTDEGVFLLWLPPFWEYEIRMLMRTFVEAFPNGTLWGTTRIPGFMLIGGRGKIDVSPERLDELAEKVARIRDLGEWNDTYADAKTIRNLYMLDAQGILKFADGAPVVTDDRPYTEFPLWRELMHPDEEHLIDADELRSRFKLPKVDKEKPKASP